MPENPITKCINEKYKEMNGEYPSLETYQTIRSEFDEYIYDNILRCDKKFIDKLCEKYGVEKEYIVYAERQCTAKTIVKAKSAKEAAEKAYTVNLGARTELWDMDNDISVYEVEEYDSHS